MLVDLLFVTLSLAMILLAAELFINAIEWLGAKLKLAEGAVGSVLAATGTALPETIIPIVAIINDAYHHTLGTPQGQSQSVGVGAIIGAPFMLGTLAFFLVGLSYFLARRRGGRTGNFDVSGDVIRHDLEFFIIAFTLGCGAGVLHHYWSGMPHWLDYLLAATLVVVYLIYLRRVFKSGAVTSHEALDPLHIIRRIPFGDENNPRGGWIALQLVLSLSLMFFGAHLFVEHFSTLALAIGVHPLVLALLIVPVATELPEKFNTVLWVNRGKDTLAMGNISGAMVFQSTFPISLGLLFLDWDFDPLDPAIISAVLGILGAVIVLLGVRKTNEVNPKHLLFSGLLYLVFCGLVLADIQGWIHLHVGSMPLHGVPVNGTPMHSIPAN